MRLRSSAFAIPADHAEPIGGINTTPLIDVLLVLLVMFIITIPMQINQIPVPLPQAGPAPVEQQQPHLLTIAAGGAVVLDGRAVSRAALAGPLAVLRDDPRAALEIKTDQRARYDDFAQTMAVVRQAGISRLRILPNE
ncbi:MAG: biopolymer transporter ExbD [Sphingomonas sp.]|uniref:ExbD/TolR family protein n=1 Tax=Sphingomonas sp. TaxID=28214 RepID=UPI0035A9A50B|nr:biopolymer transporter ExbD [Sphingomonas sp.]